MLTATSPFLSPIPTPAPKRHLRLIPHVLPDLTEHARLLPPEITDLTPHAIVCPPEIEDMTNHAKLLTPPPVPAELRASTPDVVSAMRDLYAALRAA